MSTEKAKNKLHRFCCGGTPTACQLVQTLIIISEFIPEELKSYVEMIGDKTSIVFSKEDWDRLKSFKESNGY